MEKKIERIEEGHPRCKIKIFVGLKWCLPIILSGLFYRGQVYRLRYYFHRTYA